MREHLLFSKPVYKIHKEFSIQLATFLGGPLAGAYLVAENFRAMGDTSSARKTWIVAITGTLLLMGVISMIPDDVHIPNIAYPITYVCLLTIMLIRFQRRQIQEHLQNGGAVYSIWRALFVAAMSFIILVFIALLLVLATGW